MTDFRVFDPDRAIEALVYLTQNGRTLSNLVTVFNTAQSIHLERYCMSITGARAELILNTESKSNFLSDLIQFVQREKDDTPHVDYRINLNFEMKGESLYSTRAVDLMELSESDQECLDRAIEIFGSD